MVLTSANRSLKCLALALQMAMSCRQIRVDVHRTQTIYWLDKVKIRLAKMRFVSLDTLAIKVVDWQLKIGNLEYDYGLTSSCVVVKGLGRVAKLKRKEKVRLVH